MLPKLVSHALNYTFSLCMRVSIASIVREFPRFVITGIASLVSHKVRWNGGYERNILSPTAQTLFPVSFVKSHNGMYLLSKEFFYEFRPDAA